MNKHSDTLQQLVLFVQFKKREKHPLRNVTFRKVPDFRSFTKSNTPPWVYFKFFKSYVWYQIAQSITYLTLRQLPSPNLIKYLSHFSCNYGKDRLNKLISIPELSFRVAHPIHGLTAHHLKLVTYQTAAPNRLLIHCHFLKIKTSHNLTHIILVLHFIQKPVIWFYTPI